MEQFMTRKKEQKLVRKTIHDYKKDQKFSSQKKTRLQKRRNKN
jgi:hypothetical protein